MNSLIKNTFEKIIVKDFNYNKIIEINSDATLEDCCFKMKESNETVLVITQGKKQGLITNGDILRSVIWNDIESYQQKAGSFATFELIGISLNDSLWDAIQIISKKNIRHIPILKGNSIVGMIDLLILLRVIIESNISFFNTISPIKDCFKLDIKHDEDEYRAFQNNNLENVFSQKIGHVRSLIRDMIILDFSVGPKEILQNMLCRSSKSVIIVEFGFSVKGFVSEDDILKKILFNKKFNCSTSYLMSHNPQRLRSIHTIGNAILNMHHYNYREIILVNEDDFPISVITIVDLFNYMVNIWKK